MIDLDVLFNGTSVTFLHWFQPDLTLVPSLVLTPGSSNMSTGAPYIGPAPPPGSPHRYTLLLFSQPAEFAVPDAFSDINPPTDLLARIGFNITEFITAAGLDAPLAGSYFRVVNASGTASSTGSPAQTSPVQYEGAAARTKTLLITGLGFVGVVAAMTAGLSAI
jgi:phosphatidylethanolamine-binding protein